MSPAAPRPDGRGLDEMRRVEFVPHFIRAAEGSVLVTVGETKVICTASLEDRLPPFLRGGDQGWITAEYGMIPRATDVRSPREAARGRVSGRSQEIQRLIGRSLRNVVRLPALGERTIWIDCDVIQADGGTRAASITGAFVALAFALDRLRGAGSLAGPPLYGAVAATSVGMIGGEARLDLSYEEDAVADVDMNVVRTDAGSYVEVQGTGEKTPFTGDQLRILLRLADLGIDALLDRQRQVLGGILPPLLAPGEPGGAGRKVPG
ncbi:MAG: ribonuclease PH [Acidobacteria bacterium]|nr:ribonuclease PH [Acidobacteriota bacterium]